MLFELKYFFKIIYLSCNIPNMTEGNVLAINKYIVGLYPPYMLQKNDFVYHQCSLNTTILRGLCTEKKKAPTVSQTQAIWGLVTIVVTFYP